MKQPLSMLYQDPAVQRERYLLLRDALLPLAHSAEQIRYFSAPGRTELGGNHTDHQRGHVLAAAVNIDMAAAAAPNGTKRIRVMSEGYAPIEIDIGDLSPQPKEKEQSAALIRGIAAKLRALGYPVSGFDLTMNSVVPKGSGLSSSAAFEVLIGTAMNGLFCRDTLSVVEIAQIGQWAENVYFDKPCGLMDQMASSVGDVVAMDLKDPAAPVIRKVNLSLEKEGYALAILRCGDDHADLTDAYGAIPTELHAIAEHYGKQSVLELDRLRVLSELGDLRKIAGDRAILRTFHIWDDDRRAELQAQALERQDFATYLRLVRDSGRSSWMYLQNVLPQTDPRRQSLGLTIALCEQLLGETGACRVHGGGFAGTAQAYVPLPVSEAFRQSVDRVLGDGACQLLSIRAVGGTEVEL